MTKSNSARLAVILPLLAVIGIGCGGDSGSDRTVMVPLDENMPFPGLEYRAIPDSLTGEVPAVFAGLKKAIAGGVRRMAVEAWGLHSGDVRIVGGPDGRFWILDRIRNELLEFDPEGGILTTLATAGDGPGELSFAKDLALAGDSLVVGGADRQVVVFDCAERPCSYRSTISLPFEVHSISAAGAASWAALASAPIAADATIETALAPSPAVRVFDPQGTVRSEFGATYDVAGHWMLLRELVHDGFVRYSAQSGRFVVGFERFPNWYIYDAAGNLEAAFHLNSFTLGRQKYDLDTGALDNVLEDNSRLTNLQRVDDCYQVAEVTHQANPRVANASRVWDTARRYYSLDLCGLEVTFLGDTARLKDPSIRYVPVVGGLVLVTPEAILYSGD